MKRYALEIKASIIVLMIVAGLGFTAEYLYETRPRLKTSDEVITKFVNASHDQNYRQYIQLVTKCK